MIYQVFTTLLKWKPTRRLLQWAKKRKLLQLLVPMIREWYEKDFIFQYPNITFIGYKSLEELGFVIQKKQIRKPLIITDPTLIKTKVVDKVIQQLTQHKMSHIIFDGVQSNHSTKVVYDIVEMFQKNKCDALISVGGGSAHDAIKAASLVLSNQKPIKKFQGLNVTKNVILKCFFSLVITATLVKPLPVPAVVLTAM